jgi:ABC-type transport system involved in cytochrome bd biosynthesis fused ATPase/permease subunit
LSAPHRIPGAILRRTAGKTHFVAAHRYAELGAMDEIVAHGGGRVVGKIARETSLARSRSLTP